MMNSNNRRKLAVVAVGGNALVREKGKETLPQQYAAACLTMPHVVAMIQAGWALS
jgi:carbamate kinase